MSTLHRRYEILIPLRFNDGSTVPDSLVAETLLELRARFGAVSAETQIIRGLWEHEGEVYRDEHLRVFVDVQDQPANREFFSTTEGPTQTAFPTDRYLGNKPLDRRNLRNARGRLGRELLDPCGPVQDDRPARRSITINELILPATIGAVWFPVSITARVSSAERTRYASDWQTSR